MLRRSLAVATVCLCFMCLIAARPRAARRLCSSDTLLKVQILLNQTADLSALDCRLYTPTIQHFQQRCPSSTMKCFADEVKVLIEEWENSPPAMSGLHSPLEILAKRLEPPPPASDCPQCEAFQEQRVTKFLTDLSTTIQYINAENCRTLKELPERLHRPSSSS